MIITNHRLHASQDSELVEFRLDEEGPTMRPEIAVIHYAVTESAGVTESVLKDREYLSCHVTIDSTGRVIQMVPFDVMAMHAGASNYRGRQGCNAFSLGIEISNPGPLIRGPDGTLKTTYGRTWFGKAVEARHKSGRAPANWTHWAEYSDVEFDLCCHIVDLWRAEYGIKDVVGHDDISVGRKFDPGPAFPMKALRKAVFGFEERAA